MFPRLASNSVPGLEPGTLLLRCRDYWGPQLCTTPLGERMSLVSVGLSLLTCRNGAMSECFDVLRVLWIDEGEVPSMALACKASSTR